MEVKRNAVAGTLESSDIFLEVFPKDGGIEIELQSIVMQQYGEEIKQVIADTVRAHSVDNVLIRANDRGALECVIRARVETALVRAGKDGEQ